MSTVDSQQGTARWPTGTEYSAAIQQPSTSFQDEVLREGDLTLTPLGIPASASGQNAIAFHMTSSRGPVAVRCLLNANDDGRLRYRSLERHVASTRAPAMVPATWLDEGVRVHGRWWPVVVMPWVGGEPLHVALDDRLSDSDRLRHLAERWIELVLALQACGVAHGDLQHGNVLLDDDDEFHLVDLDGIWVPDMGCGAPDEYGHPNYQHVNRSATDWGPNVDTFSALAIAASISGLASDPSLARFMTGENLLFAQADFEDPDRSPVWAALAASSDGDVVDLAARLLGFARQGRMPSVPLDEALDMSVGRADVRTPEILPPGPLPTTSGVSGAAWWSGGEATPAPPGGHASHAENTATSDSFWAAEPSEAQQVHAQPAAPGAPGTAGPTWAPVPAATRGPSPAVVGSSPPSSPTRAVVNIRSTPRLVARPLAGAFIVGAVAGFVGCVCAGVLQAVAGDRGADSGILLGVVASVLGGALHAWPALLLSNTSLAVRRFATGAAVALVAGIVAVLAVDAMIESALGRDDARNALLVACVWALTGALVGVSVGALRSARAAAFAFSGAAIAGFVSGWLHGATAARFEDRALVARGFDAATIVAVMIVTVALASAIAVALRFARLGGVTIEVGTGAGSSVDLFTARATIGDSPSDTVVLAGHELGSKAVELTLAEHHVDGVTRLGLAVDGAVQPVRFTAASGQLLAFGGVALRLELGSGGVL